MAFPRRKDEYDYKSSSVGGGGGGDCVDSATSRGNDLVGDDLDITPSAYKDGRYYNPWSNCQDLSYSDVIQWKLSFGDNSNIPSSEILDKTLPIVPPQFDDDSPSYGLRVTWLGHATVLVQFDGINMLTDPMFSQRCSPVQFAGPKRYRNAPCSVDDLPRIDAVLISHNHYDHLDLATVQALNAKYGPYLQWFVPKGLGDWMKASGCVSVEQMDWWQETFCQPVHLEVKIVFCPAQHWSARSLTDTNKSLWGGWAVIGPTRRFYFAGDTAYCEAFAQIGRRFGPFDLAAIPIGCYEPWWFMKNQHINAEMAVKIYEEIGAKRALGIHWGTFALADEFYLEPPDKLKEALQLRGLALEKFFVMKHGESRVLCP